MIPGTYQYPDLARAELRWLAQNPEYPHNLNHPAISPCYW